MYRCPALTKFLPVALCDAWWDAFLDVWGLFDPVQEYEDNFGDHDVNAEIGGGD